MFQPENVSVPMLGRPEREHIWGIPFTGAEPKYTNTAGQIWFVDPVNGNDDADGETPDKAFETLQAAVDNDRLDDYDVIYVLGALTESVVTPAYTDVASYVSIIGVGNGRYSPSWASAAATDPCLDLRCVGWRVSGFRFLGPTTDFCIELRHTDTGANDIAIRTVIEGNYFDGLSVGLGAIETHGAYDVWIKNNTFSLFNNGANTAACIVTGTTPLAIPYRNHVCGNMFYDNDNAVDMAANGSFFYDNLFQKVGYTYSSIVVLRTSQGANPGDDNVVTRNHFGGDYSNTGGYTAGAADDWVGNIAEDVAEAEVSDAGLTIARPAA